VLPQAGADERMAEILQSLYANCPPGAGIQMHLFASPAVRGMLTRYANLRVKDAVICSGCKQGARAAGQYLPRPGEEARYFLLAARERR
jgi:conjugal transfer ATP-binding protein TraC